MNISVAKEIQITSFWSIETYRISAQKNHRSSEYWKLKGHVPLGYFWSSLFQTEVSCDSYLFWYCTYLFTFFHLTPKWSGKSLKAALWLPCCTIAVGVEIQVALLCLFLIVWYFPLMGPRPQLATFSLQDFCGMPHVVTKGSFTPIVCFIWSEWVDEL